MLTIYRPYTILLDTTRLKDNLTEFDYNRGLDALAASFVDTFGEECIGLARNDPKNVLYVTFKTRESASQVAQMWSSMIDITIQATDDPPNHDLHTCDEWAEDMFRND